MCEFCVKHGEGKKWYLNAKNYSDDLLNDIRRRKITISHFYWVDRTYKQYFNFFKNLPLHIPLIQATVKAVLKSTFQYVHWGQVVPIEDVKRILAITNSITRVPCVCRMSTKKKEERVCFLISMNPGKMGIADIIDQSYFGGPDIAKFEGVTREWAVSFFKESEKKGMIHTVWALKAPFVGTLCNCDYSTGCIPMLMLTEIVPVMFKSEYIACIDKNLCVGCQECSKVCQFKAVLFDKKDKKSMVDKTRCYGCGICRRACKNTAIILTDRYRIPEALKTW
ncbi:MAG: 4Fe-4S ferredoxin [Candidatus Omnitrophica bacterium]|nr:4Fe-4S ferredoxin [Candidatus Omnitrophota bacterium]